MAGYSGTPLPRKLGIAEGDRVSIIDAPAPLPGGLSELPAGVTVRTSARGKADVFRVSDRPR